MALNLDGNSGTIEVISSKDPSVTCDGEAYKQYLDTLDETLLGLAEGSEPTRFVMKRILPFGLAQKVKTEQASFNEEGKVQVRMGYMLDEVRGALVDVKNPGGEALKYRKDSDGYAARDLIALLEGTGILNELFSARQGAVKTGPSKKS